MAVDSEARAVIQQIQDDTLGVDELNGTQRKQLEEAIHPTINGFRAWKGSSNTNYSSWEVGDSLFNIDNTGKVQILGYIIAIPFDPTSDLDDTTKFDKYQNNKPAF